MKLIIIEHEDFAEVTVRDTGGINLHVFTFDDRKQARAFCQGFAYAKDVANRAVQSLPMGYETVKQ
jgi:hypothetical protein